MISILHLLTYFLGIMSDSEYFLILTTISHFLGIMSEHILGIISISEHKTPKAGSMNVNTLSNMKYCKKTRTMKLLKRLLCG